MVRAILDGRKTQTRRGVKPQPTDGFQITKDAFGRFPLGSNHSFIRYVDCPYGQPGDRLWVRETHGFWCHSVESVGVEYAAGGEDKIVDFPEGIGMPSLEVQCRKNIGGGRRKRPSIHMPRWASRLTLEITGVRVERLQDINEQDAKAEGSIPLQMDRGLYLPRFEGLWESINGPGSWALNPWVWVIELRRVTQ